MEKAYSKINLNYLNSEGGFTSQPLKALLGCPVKWYSMSLIKFAYEYGVAFDTMKARTENNLHFFAASTSKTTEDDQKVNECGITGQHAFPVISYVYLYDGDVISHRLFMMRDPRGMYAHTRSNKKWNANDTQSWITGY